MITAEELFIDACVEKHLMGPRHRSEIHAMMRDRSTQVTNTNTLRLPSAFHREKQLAKEFEHLDPQSTGIKKIQISFNSKKRTLFRFKLPNLSKPANTSKTSNPHAYHLPAAAVPSNRDLYDFFNPAAAKRLSTADHSFADTPMRTSFSARQLEKEDELNSFNHNFSLKKKARVDMMLKARKDTAHTIEKIKNSKTFIKSLNSLCCILEQKVKARALQHIRLKHKMVLLSELKKRRPLSLQPIEPALVSKTTEESNLTWRMILIERFLEEPISRDALETEDKKSLFNTNSNLLLDNQTGSSRDMLNSSNSKKDSSLLHPPQNKAKNKLLKQHSEILRDNPKTDPYSLHPSKLLKSGDYSSYWLVCMNRCLAEDCCFDIKQIGFISCFKTNFDPNPKEAEHHLHLQPGTFVRPLLDYQETLLSMLRIYKWNNHSIENDDKFFRNHHLED